MFPPGCLSPATKPLLTGSATFAMTIGIVRVSRWTAAVAAFAASADASPPRIRGASDHSITSSARASTLAGISMPSAFAVLRLTTSSYLVGACTGRSAGFSPLRMRST